MLKQETGGGLNCVITDLSIFWRLEVKLPQIPDSRDSDKKMKTTTKRKKVYVKYFITVVDI